MTDLNKMKLSEPLMIKIRNKMTKEFQNLEQELTKTINPKISNKIIFLLKCLDETLTSEYKKINNTIENMKENENSTSKKLKTGTLNEKLDLYFSEKPMPVQQRMPKIRKTGVDSDYFRTKIRTFLRKGN